MQGGRAPWRQLTGRGDTISCPFGRQTLSTGQVHWPRCSETRLTSLLGSSTGPAAPKPTFRPRLDDCVREGDAPEEPPLPPAVFGGEVKVLWRHRIMVDPARSGRSTRPCGGYSVI